MPRLGDIIKQLGKDKLGWPVIISKKDLKLAEKKAKKAAAADNPLNPKNQAKAVPDKPKAEGTTTQGAENTEKDKKPKQQPKKQTEKKDEPKAAASTN